MILKSSRRAGSAKDARELLRHLLHGAGNETVREFGLPSCIGRALDDARMAAPDGRDAVWHLSVSPAIPLTEAQWARVEEVIRDAYRLPGDLPITWGEHGKPHRPGIRSGRPPRPPHRHAVFPSWDPVTGRRISPWKHYVLNERVARQLEHEFGHPPTRGRHNRHVAAWCNSNGMTDLAAWMEAAGLLEGAPPVQAVRDNERQVAARRGEDPFSAVDASATALAVALEDGVFSPGDAFREEMLREGYVLARGERLVLVPVAGGKPVGAARKARLTEASLRQVLGDELGRLPSIDRDADSAAWLAAWKSTLIKENRHDDDAEDSQGPRAVVGGRPAKHPEREHRGPPSPGTPANTGPERPQPGIVRGAAGGRDGGLARAPARPPGTAAGRGGQDGAAAAADGNVRRPAGAHRGQDRRPGTRRRLECVLASRALAAIPDADDRLGELTARVRAEPPAPWRDPLPPEVAVRLPRHMAVVRVSGREEKHSREARRSRWLAAALRGAYGLGWVPEALVANLVCIDVDEKHQAVILLLRSGTRIVDRQDRIDVVGTADDVAIGELVEAVRRRGWSSVQVHGSLEFRKAAARRLRALVPSVSVVGDVPVQAAVSVAVPGFFR